MERFISFLTSNLSLQQNPFFGLPLMRAKETYLGGRRIWNCLSA
jgi:hypothetical protein